MAGRGNADAVERREGEAVIRTDQPGEEPLIYWRDFPRIQEALVVAVLALDQPGDEETLRRIEEILERPAL